MSLLTIIQNVAAELNLPAPETVITATDKQTVTMLALANREGKLLATRGRWQEMTKIASFTTVAAELQGTMESIAPGFNYLLGKTMWNQSMIQPVYGGLYPEDWEQLEAYTVQGPYPKYRIRNKSLYMLPIPTAGQTIAFEYMSRYWCQSSGGTLQDAWADDTDTGVLEEDLMTMGIKWRYLRSVGLDYSQEFADYESELADNLTRGQALRDIRAGGSNWPPLGQIGVAVGNWNI